MIYPCSYAIVPTVWIYSIQFEFWSPQQHQHLRLHSTCHLNNRTYPLTPDLHWHPISTLAHLVPITANSHKLILLITACSGLITDVTDNPNLDGSYLSATKYWSLPYIIFQSSASHKENNLHTHTHTHNCFTAVLEFVRDYPGQQVPER